MKNIFSVVMAISVAFALFFASCVKKDVKNSSVSVTTTTSATTSVTTGSTTSTTGVVLEGGKGGSFSLAIFSMYKGNGKDSRVYIKYAADKMPTDTNMYDAKDNTMTEPGFGPHVHFSGLKKGTYFIHAQSAALSGDTVIVRKDSSAKSQDFNINLK